MQGGGLMQLVAYGAQDVYLSGNTSIWNGSSSKPNKYKILLPGKKKRGKKRRHGFRISTAEGYPTVLWDASSNTIVLDLVEKVFESFNPILIVDDDLDDLDDLN